MRRNILHRTIYLYSTLGAILLTTLLGGCAGMPITLAPSSSPVAPGVRGTIPAYGSNCQFDLFGIIPVTHSLNTQAALDRAKESADADVLTDVTVDFGASYYVLFSNNCVRVRGKGVPRTPSTSAATATPAATVTPTATPVATVTPVATATPGATTTPAATTPKR